MGDFLNENLFKAIVLSSISGIDSRLQNGKSNRGQYVIFLSEGDVERIVLRRSKRGATFI